MPAEPAITFLDLANTTGADAAHDRTIEGTLRKLYRDALTSRFPADCLGWNLHSHRHRMLPDEYPRLAMQPDGCLDLSPGFVLITPKQIVETLAGDKWPDADRALELLYAGAGDEACRLVAEGPLPDDGSQARLFVESLAITLTTAWNFCERHGLAVPAALRQMLVAWLEGGNRVRGPATKFAPERCIAIPDAVIMIIDELHPGERHRAAAELRHQSGELPHSYHRHCENEKETVRLLLQALTDGEPAALVKVAADNWAVPLEYWKSDGAEMTLSFGTLCTADLPSEDWKQHHGRSCFFEEGPFRRWLRSKCRPAAPAESPSAVGAKAFDSPIGAT